MSNLSQWVRAHRQARGWTQDQLAAASGLTQAYISKLERDVKVRPGAETLAALARTFGMSVDEVITAAGLGTTDPPYNPTLDEIRALAATGGPHAQQFLARLETEYPYASEQTWHILTQVLQSLVAQDRAQQAGEGSERPAQAASPEDSDEAPPPGVGGRSPLMASGC